MKKPRLRLECKDGPRPCPWVSCKYHLALDVAPNGSIIFNWGKACGVRTWQARGKSPEGMIEAVGELIGDGMDRGLETCALDVAEKSDGLILESVGKLLRVTRERIRQIESAATGKLKAEDGFEDYQPAEGEGQVYDEPMSPGTFNEIKAGLDRFLAENPQYDVKKRSFGSLTSAPAGYPNQKE